MSMLRTRFLSLIGFCLILMLGVPAQASLTTDLQSLSTNLSSIQTQLAAIQFSSGGGTCAQLGTLNTSIGSKTGGGSLDHPVMVSSQDVAGSLVLDVNDAVLDMRFLDSSGAVTDSFTVLKLGVASAPGARAPAPGFALLGASPQPSAGAVELSYRLPHA